MSSENQESQACDACGCSAEVGYMIKEGDDIAEVSIFGQNKHQLETEWQQYLVLAKTVNDNVIPTIVSSDESELHARLQFECSAEKLIFELKSRTLRK
ncbi:MAG: YfcZ/YiiS family protein [Aliivibrio sp.]|uniref:DUF406 family protein n=1 Tax=Aliivibrio sp. TaxID=1872443 RepID=UPI001A57E7BD|nr:YfcZ/YiiS family protein [Aliivibrio sp.]